MKRLLACLTTAAVVASGIHTVPTAAAYTLKIENEKCTWNLSDAELDEISYLKVGLFASSALNILDSFTLTPAGAARSSEYRKPVDETLKTTVNAINFERFFRSEPPLRMTEQELIRKVISARVDALQACIDNKELDVAIDFKASETPTPTETTEPTSEPTPEPTAEPTSEPTTEPETSTVESTTQEPTTEPTSEPTSEEPAPTTTTKPGSSKPDSGSSKPDSGSSKPTGDASSSKPGNGGSSWSDLFPGTQPTAEPAPKPTTQPTTQPTSEPTGEPTSQPAPAPGGNDAKPDVEPGSARGSSLSDFLGSSMTDVMEQSQLAGLIEGSSVDIAVPGSSRPITISGNQADNHNNVNQDAPSSTPEAKIGIAIGSILLVILGGVAAVAALPQIKAFVDRALG